MIFYLSLASAPNSCSNLIRSFFLPLSCDSFSSFPPSFFLYPYLDFFLASTFVFSFVVCLPDTFSSHQSHLYCCCLPTLCPKIPFSVFFFYSCHHPPPSMQQRSHQYEGAACEWQCSGGALGSSGGYLPPTHPPLPGVIQLDVTRWQLWGNTSHWCQTQTGRDWVILTYTVGPVEKQWLTDQYHCTVQVVLLT